MGFIITFNIIWLIGLFFFGIHLILLGRIIGKPRIIALFLALVAIPSIVGELSLAIWLLAKGGAQKS